MKRLLAIFTTLLMLLASCSSLQVNKCNPFYAMDTVIQVTLYNDSSYIKHYDEIKAIYNKVDNLSTNFSSYNGLSIYDLNMNREIVLDSALKELLNYSIEACNNTNGYFSIYLGKLNTYLKSYINDEIKELDKDKIEALLAEANDTKIIIDGNKAKLIGNGDIDLGGIAKGYATKLAEEYLESEGVKSFLINAGDSNISIGKKGEDDFTIGLSKPFENGIYLTLKLSNYSIGTSSPKYQFKEVQGIRYHHIINPFTGYSSNLYDSVSVFTDDSLLADAYSTAIFSMDLATAKEFVENNNLKAVIYKNSEILYRSIGL